MSGNTPTDRIQMLLQRARLGDPADLKQLMREFERAEFGVSDEIDLLRPLFATTSLWEDRCGRLRLSMARPEDAPRHVLGPIPLHLLGLARAWMGIFGLGVGKKVRGLGHVSYTCPEQTMRRALDFECLVMALKQRSCRRKRVADVEAVLDRLLTLTGRKGRAWRWLMPEFQEVENNLEAWTVAGCTEPEDAVLAAEHGYTPESLFEETQRGWHDSDVHALKEAMAWMRMDITPKRLRIMRCSSSVRTLEQYRLWFEAGAEPQIVIRWDSLGWQPGRAWDNRDYDYEVLFRKRYWKIHARAQKRAEHRARRQEAERQRRTWQACGFAWPDVQIWIEGGATPEQVQGLSRWVGRERALAPAFAERLLALDDGFLGWLANTERPMTRVLTERLLWRWHGYYQLLEKRRAWWSGLSLEVRRWRVNGGRDEEELKTWLEAFKLDHPTVLFRWRQQTHRLDVAVSFYRAGFSSLQMRRALERHDDPGHAFAWALQERHKKRR